MRSIVSTRVWLNYSAQFAEATFLGCSAISLGKPSPIWDGDPGAGYNLYLFNYQGTYFATFGKLSGFSNLASDSRVLLTDSLCKSLLLQAKQHQCSFLVGPMDGDTWHSYRCLEKPGSEPAFTLEPQLQLDSGALRQAGFEVIASYGSSIEQLGSEVLYLQDHNQDVYVESLSGMAFEDLIAMFHEAALADFSENFFFRPIDRESFLGLYLPLKHLLNLDYILAARERKTGAVIGLIFAYQDQELAQRLIIKTIHVNKNRRGRGVSRLLLNSMHKRAFEKGFKEVIHGLYKSDNKSRQLSMSMGARRFTEYLLWGIDLKGVNRP